MFATFYFIGIGPRPKPHIVHLSENFLLEMRLHIMGMAEKAIPIYRVEGMTFCGYVFQQKTESLSPNHRLWTFPRTENPS